MISSIEIKQIDITDLDVDAIVNAANARLQEGGGVCGAIFSKAGSMELTDACSNIGGCEIGNAVITPGFNLSAKYIIHAVGPIWQGGGSDEEKLLYNTYKQALTLAMEYDCRSIAFPLISSGIYGYPKNEAWKVAVKACRDFIDANPDYAIHIIFAVLSLKSKEMGEKQIYD